MKINDSKNNLLAIIIRSDDIPEGKYFETENEQSIQLASFKLKEETIIEKHIHPKQERKILNTSEVLIMLEGEMEVTIYDEELNFVQSETIYAGDTLGLFSGGHGLKLQKDSKFIDVKQGPYNPETDKKRF